MDLWVHSASSGSSTACDDLGLHFSIPVAAFVWFMENIPTEWLTRQRRKPAANTEGLHLLATTSSVSFFSPVKPRLRVQVPPPVSLCPKTRSKIGPHSRCPVFSFLLLFLFLLLFGAYSFVYGKPNPLKAVLSVVTGVDCTTALFTEVLKQLYFLWNLWLNNEDIQCTFSL